MQRGSAVHVDGGVDGGNGGFLELSGHQVIRPNGEFSVRALASGYRGGTLYYDPADTNITSNTLDPACGVTITCLDPALAFVGVTNVVDSPNNLRVLSPIANADVNNGVAGGSLILNAGNDLTVSAPIGTSGTRFDHDLSLNAGNNVIVSNSIYLGNRTLTLAADATIPSLGAVTNGVGDVIIFDPVSRTFSHFNDFTRASNPTPGGTWTYGFMTTLGGALTLYNTGDSISWFHSLVNSVNTPQVSQGSFHPGPNNEYSVIRFTAPVAGTYNLSSTFTPFDAQTTTDVHILRGGTSLFSGNTIGATGTSQAFSSTLTLAAGQTVDFAVGFGPDNYRFDTTGVTVKLVRPPFVVDTLGSINVSGVNFKVLGGANMSAAVRAAGNITVNSTGAVTILAGPAIADNAVASSGASVSAGTSISITAASLTVKGGDNSEASAIGNASANADANASASLTAGQSITIAVSGAVLVQGGSQVEASASVDSGVTVATGQRSATMNANASITAGSNLTLNAGSLTVTGGTEAEASAAGTDSSVTTSASGPYSDTATTTSNASITAGSNLNITVSGAAIIKGGTNASASATDSSVTGTKSGTASANALVSANGSLNLQAGSLTVSGGDGAEVEASDSGTNLAAANATATVSAAQTLTLAIGGAMAVKGGAAIEATADFDSTFNVDPAPARNDATANVSANILAGTDLVVSAAALTVAGGAMTASGPYPNMANATPAAGRTTDTNSVTVNTNALLSAGRDASITVTAGSLVLAGGQHGASDRVLATGLDNNSATANANAKISSGSNLTVAVSGGDVNISGGTVNACGPIGATPACAAGGNNATVANANAEMTAVGLTSISASGNLLLAGGSTITGAGGTASAYALLGPGALAINTGGDVVLTGGGGGANTGATIQAIGTVNVLATFLNLTAGSSPAQLKAGTDLGIGAGEIKLLGGGGTNAFAEIRGGPGAFHVTTTASATSSGDVLLTGGTGNGAFARIFGNPDVGSLLLPVSVGGAIRMNSGSGTGASASIASASPTSIYINFPNPPASGGYFVNGVEGVVHDSGTSSGFVGGALSAVLNTNLFVTYGLTLPPSLPPGSGLDLDVANRVLIQAVNQTASTGNSAPATGQDGGGAISGGTNEEKQKKSLPMCSK
jgi:hypothetical protein